MTYKEFVTKAIDALQEIYSINESKAIAVRVLTHYLGISDYEYLVSPNVIIPKPEVKKLQGALDEGVAHIEQLVAAEAILFVAQTHALEAVVGHIAPVDGEIVGAGGELDIARLAGFLGIEHPEGGHLVDLFDGNFSHKASPFVMIAQFSLEGKCFSPADRRGF